MLSSDFNNAELLEQIAVVIPDLIYLLDIESKTRKYFNKDIYISSGYSENDIKQPEDTFILDTTHPSDLAKVLDRFKDISTLQNGQTYEFEYRFKKKDGQYLWLNVRERVLKRDDTGKPTQIIGITQDITKHKENEINLKTLTDTFTSAFKYSGIGIALVSLDGKWMDVNKMVCKITGYSKEELLTLTFQDITHPDDLSVDLGLVRKMLNKEIDTYNLEKRYITKNRKIVWALLTVSLVWDDEKPGFFIAQIVDITDRKELMEALAIKNVELEAAKDSLIYKIKQLEELNYMIAHNLRGPANNFKLLADILLEKENDTEGSLNDGFSKADIVKLLSQGSDALVNSLNSLLELVTVKLNKSIQFDQCDIEYTCNEIIRQLSSIIYEKEADIKYVFAVKEISCPKQYFESILYNLISNALKYTHSHVKPVITISAYPHKDMVIVSVKDNGIGIDLEKYGDKIFKFQQVFHQGFDSKGLGLFLIKNQIESIGGSIAINSKANEGSEFLVSFKSKSNQSEQSKNL